MQKITRITVQQKNKSRYNIFLGEKSPGEYAFSVDEAVLIEFGLRKGLELDKKTIEKIEQRETLYKSYTQTIHYLSYRMRSRKEIYDYLAKKEVIVEYIDEIITRLENEKLINDSEFAEMFVRGRINTSTKGPQMIRNELKEKGIPSSDIEAALEQFTFEKQYEKVEKFIQKKLRQSSKHSHRKQVEQIQANLMRKGFSGEVIKAAIDPVKQEKDSEKEWDVLVEQGNKIYERQSKKWEGFELEQKVKEGLYRKGFQFNDIATFIDSNVKNKE